MIAFDIDVNDWREVDRNLRSLARRRAALDAEEARWLRAAEQLQIWRPLGMVSAIDYCERVMGYTPHVAMERLRVARSLEALPALEASLAEGALNFSAIRELTRVATPSTEAAWRDRALGKNVRQIEELVAGHAPGDHPDDAPNPDLRHHNVSFKLSPEVYARLRQTQTALAEQHGSRLDDDALFTTFCDSTLERAGTEPTGRAKFQILMTVCRKCEATTQQGSGLAIPVDKAALERAKCDAVYIGSTDDAKPVRAAQDIPPSVVRFVWHRDGGKCTTPGCRSAIGIEIHHIIPRWKGGSHDPSNLRLQCSACHMGIHRDVLEIVDGVAIRVNAPSERNATTPTTRARDSSSFDLAASRTQARDALVQLGWKPHVARTAVDEAMSHVGRDAPLEMLICEALRRCPKPRR